MFRKKYEENINFYGVQSTMDLAYETLKIHKNELAPKVSKTPNDILK